LGRLHKWTAFVRSACIHFSILRARAARVEIGIVCKDIAATIAASMLNFCCLVPDNHGCSKRLD